MTAHKAWTDKQLGIWNNGKTVLSGFNTINFNINLIDTRYDVNKNKLKLKMKGLLFFGFHGFEKV